eukprot:scaffold7820_cov99-Skeletonema_marinoi.AAC.8
MNVSCVIINLIHYYPSPPQQSSRSFGGGGRGVLAVAVAMFHTAAILLSSSPPTLFCRLILPRTTVARKKFGAEREMARGDEAMGKQPSLLISIPSHRRMKTLILMLDMSPSKGLRGGDDRDLELDTVQIDHIIPEGGSATIHCGSGSQCCVASSFKVVDDTGPSEWGSGCNDGFSSITDGTAGVCQMEVCTISCDSPSCKVDFEAGSAGRGGFVAAALTTYSLSNTNVPTHFTRGSGGGHGGMGGEPGEPGGMGGGGGGAGGGGGGDDDNGFYMEEE